MLKIGIFPDEISQDFERALFVTAKEFDLKYIELRTLWNKNLIDLSETDLKRAKRMIEKQGLSVSCIASPFLKCRLKKSNVKENIFYGKKSYYIDLKKSQSSIDEHLDILKHSIELANMFSTRLVRCFSFWKEEEFNEEILKTIVDQFEKPLEIAKREGIILALENEPTCYIGTGAQARSLLNIIQSPNLKLTWDPGNAFTSGEIPYPDGYEKIKDEIVHVHIKDYTRNRKTGKMEVKPVGAGEIDLTGQFQDLLKNDFNGVISLETAYVPPTGDKEQGSRESLQGLKKIMMSIK
jgi:sugar phosphate isomerase/epimerase